MSNRTLAFACALAAHVLVAAPAMAQETAASVAGSWRYADQPSDVIESAIERGIDDMNFITKPIARRRLRATNDAYSTVEVRIGGGEVTTVLEGRSITAPADGSAISWRREDGEVMQVTTAMRDGALVQSFAAEDGSRENVYSVSADGRRLTMQVTIRSPRLPAPIVYRMLFDRVS